MSSNDTSMGETDRSPLRARRDPAGSVPGRHRGRATSSWSARRAAGAGTYPFDVVVTLYADANPAPWGVEELRFGFPDIDLKARTPSGSSGWPGRPTAAGSPATRS